MRHIARIMSLGLLGTMLLAGPVNAGKPEMAWESVDAPASLDAELTAACGTEVQGEVSGHIVWRLFTNDVGDPVREVNNYAIRVHLWSEFGEIHFTDVGADRVTYMDDGSLVVIVIGNVRSFSVPGEGRVYSDVGRTMLVITFDASGDPIVEATSLGGQHDADQLGPICSALAG